jgi:predicted PurR-regulated permease PerM
MESQTPRRQEPAVPRVVSFIVLVAILLLMGAMFFQVLAQFVVPLFLAAVLVVIFKPLHEWVRGCLPRYRRLSALITTTAIMLLALLPTVWLGWNAYREGRGVLIKLQRPETRVMLERKFDEIADPIRRFLDPTREQPGPDERKDADEKAPNPAAPLPSNGNSADGERVPGDEAASAEVASTTRDIGEIDDAVTPMNFSALYERAAGMIGRALLHTAQGLLRLLIGLIIMVLALYYFLLDGPSMIAAIMRMSPLDDVYERELLDKFASVSRAVVVASLASAVVQGLLSGIGYYFALNAGAPIFLLTMVTMVLAIVPFVGATGVWLPTAAWIYFFQTREVNDQLVQGDPASAIGLAIYGAAVVSMIDNVIKPLVLHGQSNLHPLLALLSVLGGIQVLGPIGILVGPMLVAFFQALVNMVNKELQRMGDGTLGVKHSSHRTPLPMHPATELEADAAAGSKSVVEEVAAAMVGSEAPAPGASPEVREPHARGRSEAPKASPPKRRHRRR